MKDYEIYQAELLESIKRQWRGSLSKRTEEAYHKVPRHFFIQRFSVDAENWVKLTAENLPAHLPLLYADHTLLLYDEPPYVCTISQPSLVLKMLEMLDVHPGQRVLELGAGSGWNAALLGELVGKQGLVVSLEIIPEMVKRAWESLEQFNLPQVHILEGDATQGGRSDVPFDRGIFTAGAYDIPAAFYHEIKEGGKLLFVLKLPTQGDLLLLLRKENNHFVELDRLHVRFVAVTGQAPAAYALNEDEILASRRLSLYPRSHQQPRGAIPAAESWIVPQ